MKITHAPKMKWLGNDLRHRSGKILVKRLLEGEPGNPENYKLLLTREGADFDSPRHRHPWDQVRFCLSGSVPIGPRKTVDAGEVGYFPEGAHYGPQSGPEEREVVVLQFGGASGMGILSSDEVNRGYDELSREGRFEKGVFRRVGGTGRRNQDGYEAIWNHITGEKLVFPAPRYREPVVMNPANFAWRPMPGVPGVECKDLGTFSERATRVAFLRLQPGRRRALPKDPAMQLLYVVKGRGKVGREPYGRHTAIERAPGEGIGVTPGTATELLAITIPSVAAMGLEAA